MVKILCNDVFGLTVEEVQQLGIEELYKLCTVNITASNGESVDIYYESIKSGKREDYIYTYPISQNGNYTFKATNSRGRSSEITVPVEIDESKIKTFTLEVSETETKTFSFIEGQTWEDFIGKSGEVVIIDGVEFLYFGDNTRFGSYSLALIDGEDRIKVLPTDEIVENGIYSSALGWKL